MSYVSNTLLVRSINVKIVLHQQTAHADAVAGLPLAGLCRTVELVRSTRLQTFVTMLNFHPSSR